MSKHTTGPWVMVINKELKKIGIASIELYHQGNSKCGICEINLNTPEDSANARLIAAAPEMLETLREVVIGLSSQKEHFLKTINEIEQVIAKAEGK